MSTQTGSAAVLNHQTPSLHDHLQTTIDDVQAWYYRDPAEDSSAHRSYLTEKYGGPDHAVIAVGALIAARAEEHAKLTTAQAQAAWARQVAAAQFREVMINLDTAARRKVNALLCLAAAHQPPSASKDGRVETERELTANQSLQSIQDPRPRLGEILAGPTARIADDLHALRVGYRRAIAEVRPVGGLDLIFHERSTDCARVVFNEAVIDFPTNWIEAANGGGKPLMARVVEGRAHYNPDAQHVADDAPVVDRSYLLRLAPDDPDPVDDRIHRYEKVDLPEEGVNVWRVFTHEASRKTTDPNSPPRGKRWEYYDDEQGGIWRRPVRVRQAEETPEILTDWRCEDSILPPGRATAKHECAHLFEHHVPGIVEMEQDFLLRRTTTEGNRAPLTRIHIEKGVVEKVRAGGFVDEYIGKDYGDAPGAEVLSMGVEAIFGGTMGGLIGVLGHQADLEMRNFILGVLATAKK